MPGLQPMMPRLLQEYPACSDCGFIARLEVVNLADVDLDTEDPQEVAYRRHVTHTTREMLASTPLETLRKRYDVAPVHKQFGSWAVTTYGLECLTDQYAIEKSRLAESDWEYHMSGKTWVLMEDFAAALRAARTRYRIPVSPSVRFAVFQRDSFRCRLCGASPDDGLTVLELDHRVPVARGGKSKSENLWTLCWDCNRGKSARLLAGDVEATHD